MVSIIMNCYNSAEYLKEALDSIRRQTYDNYEVIFVDNCSTDNSAIIAKTFGNKLKYFRTDKVVPLGAGRNIALRHCSGEYIAFLDCDDLWEANKLEIQVRLLDEHPECSLSVSNFYILNMINKTKKPKLKDNTLKIISFRDFALKYQYAMSSFVITKKYLERMPFLFDERLTYNEDYDFFIRLTYYGDALYTPETLSNYRVHDNMTTKHIKEQIPAEKNIVIENMKTCDPNIYKIYPEFYESLIFVRDYIQTKIYVEKGERVLARETIKHYALKHKKSFVFYLITYLPSSLMDKLYWKVYGQRTV